MLGRSSLQSLETLSSAAWRVAFAGVLGMAKRDSQLRLCLFRGRFSGKDVMSALVKPPRSMRTQGMERVPAISRPQVWSRKIQTERSPWMSGDSCVPKWTASMTKASCNMRQRAFFLYMTRHMVTMSTRWLTSAVRRLARNHRRREPGLCTTCWQVDADVNDAIGRSALDIEAIRTAICASNVFDVTSGHGGFEDNSSGTRFVSMGSAKNV